MSRRYAGMVANPPPYMDRMITKAATKSGDRARRCPSEGTRGIQQDAEREEDHVGVAPADVVGGARPEEPADHVEQAQQADERRRRRGVTRPVKISWIIGEAWPITPMPAVTFMHSTTHSSQNCGVRQATIDRHLRSGHELRGCRRAASSPPVSSRRAGTRTE